MSEENMMHDEMPSSGPSSDDKLWGALAYVFSPLVSVILLLMEDKKSVPSIKQHAVQSLIMGVLIYFIIGPFTLGCGYVLWFLMLYWAYKAYQGQDVNIPIVTDFIKNQGWA